MGWRRFIHAESWRSWEPAEAVNGKDIEPCSEVWSRGRIGLLRCITDLVGGLGLLSPKLARARKRLRWNGNVDLPSPSSSPRVCKEGEREIGERGVIRGEEVNRNPQGKNPKTAPFFLFLSLCIFCFVYHAFSFLFPSLYIYIYIHIIFHFNTSQRNRPKGPPHLLLSRFAIWSLILENWESTLMF